MLLSFLSQEGNRVTDLVSEMIAFQGESGKIQAYLSRPETGEARPAVLLIHEIYGLVDHTKNVADRFARQGYVVMAPHLYSRADMVDIMTPENIQAAMQFSMKLGMEKIGDRTAVQQELARLPQEARVSIQNVLPLMYGRDAMERKNYYTGELLQAVDFLNEQNYVRKGKVGCVGFCFGGGLSFQLACQAKLSACVVFYGQNPTPIDLVKNIPCPVLGLYGAEDMRINQDLDKLVTAMTENKKDFEMRIFPGAGHAFFNDTNKVTYRQGAALEAWDKVLTFYRRTLSD
jgi:carboxymethylenebutenolidase